MSIFLTACPFNFHYKPIGLTRYDLEVQALA